MAKRRTANQRNHDIIIEAEMSLKGYSYRAIANHMNEHFGRSITHQTVFKDVNKYYKTWHKEKKTLMEHALAIEAERTFIRDRQLWNAWEQSCKEKVERKINRKGKAKSEGVEDMETETTYRHGKGDPRYMDLLAKNSEFRAKLFGLFAPSKTDLRFEKLNSDQLTMILNSIIGDENDS